MVNCLKSLVLDGKSLTIYALFSLLYQHCNAFWYCHATDFVLIVLMLMQQLMLIKQNIEICYCKLRYLQHLSRL